MMKKCNTATLVFFTIISSSAFALDLTPREVWSNTDGPPVKRFFFEHEGKRLSFRIDNQMTINGISEAVAFRFDDINTAGLRLSKSQLQTALPFDEKNLSTYRAAARGFLPADAANIQLDEEISDAIPINGWTSQQYVFSYTLFGVPYRRSVTFLNFSAQEQLIFEVGAKTTDYDKAYMRGYRVLNSLGELPTSKESGPT